ncbi:PorP/SprF family type IX secretion system membrane protein [Sphingobacterium sp. xlx-130]|uniref:PorP/SprF family type IX secretion system membrane protein n=1 Tax=Sphingobacterium sp. xlx-130 TaxID=2654323 RepID=UPI0013DCF413|nr:PorP/SprF family type IX secretion system membrane protein [Sphingobacterium sp. xlx-130]
MKTLNIIMSLLILLPLCSRAQHGVSYNQFGQLRNSFNSSLSTMDEQGNFSLLGRSQWMGVDGAPRSLWASGHGMISKLGLAIGGDIKHASLGVVKENEVTAFASKAVRLDRDEYLSLSMGGGLLFYQGDYNQLDPNDPTFKEDIRETAGILSISTSYYKKDKYYFGVSMPRFSLNRSGDQEYEFRNVYYVTGGALFKLDNSFYLRPSFLVSHMDNITPRYDVSALVFMGTKLGLGMGVQNQGDLSGLLQLNFGSFGIGYSYQFSPKSNTLNQRISNNTHEIGFRYRIGGIGLL